MDKSEMKDIYRDTMQQAKDQGIGMKWYLFIIYAQLLIAPVWNVLAAFSYITGGQYQGNAHIVYMLYPGLQILDIIYGIEGIIMGIFAFFVVRKQLKAFRTYALRYLNTYLGIQVASSILYLIIFVIITNISSSVSAELSALAITVSIILYNIKYFRDRESLFIN